MRGNLLKWLRKILILSIAPLGIYGTLELSRYFGTDAQYLPDAAFFTVFEEIKVDQFAWNPRMGRGGIYWVSENEIVTMADINKERGIYLINVLNGSSKKLVDTGRSDSKLHGYCFSQGVLFVSAQLKSEPFKIEYRPSNFEVVSNRTEELGDRIRSGVRCGYFERPDNSSGAGIYGLLEEDGLVKLKRGGERWFETASLIDHQGRFIKTLTTDINLIQGVRGRPAYHQFFDGYFGYTYISEPCRGISTWWLERNKWDIRSESFCLGEWSLSGSTVVVPTKEGLIAEQHGKSEGRPWAMYYLLTRKHHLPVDMVGGRGVSTAPDGCRVAYGSGEFEMNWNNGFTQYLKIFDACAYIDVRESKTKDA